MDNTAIAEQIISAFLSDSRFAHLSVSQRNALLLTRLPFNQIQNAINAQMAEYAQQHREPSPLDMSGQSLASDSGFLTDLSSGNINLVEDLPEPGVSRFHASVRVDQSPLKGRYTVARELIPANTVILNERPIVAIVFGEQLNRFCGCCYKQLSLPVACVGCDEVRFCGAICAASYGHHYVECGVAGLVSGELDLQLSAYLAFRLIGRVGCDRVIDFDPNSSHPLSPERQLFHRFWSLTFPLETDVDIGERSAIIIASFKVAFYLKFLGLFLCDDGDRQKFSALLTAIQACVYRIKVNVYSLTTAGIHFGSAVVIDGSLFNHSCVPNVNYRWQESEQSIVWRTVRDIRPEEELNVTYGPMVWTRAVNARQELLRGMYYFDCKCEACVSELDKNKYLKCQSCPNGYIRYTFQSVDTNCQLCGANYVDIDAVLTRIYHYQLDVRDLAENIAKGVDVEQNLRAVDHVMAEWSHEAFVMSTDYRQTCRNLCQLFRQTGQYDRAVIYGALCLPDSAYNALFDDRQPVRDDRQVFDDLSLLCRNYVLYLRYAPNRTLDDVRQCLACNRVLMALIRDCLVNLEAFYGRDNDDYNRYLRMMGSRILVNDTLRAFVSHGYTNERTNQWLKQE